ncbi:MAG: VWA domain-containing protein [Polyangiaceae bacterium]|nr:VWA domain-containing protein [Polyangiaceae bacterium]
MSTPLSPRVRNLLSASVAILVTGIGFYFFRKYVLPHPTLTFKFRGEPIELLDPKMLGLVLVSPFFVWMTGRSLADLPRVQNFLATFLRIAFVALLALGLSRPVKTTSDERVCTVYLADVSESIPDGALEDYQQEIQAGIDQKAKDDVVRVVTFARRPRAVDLLNDGKKAPPVERHEPLMGPETTARPGEKAKRLGLGAGTDIESALELGYGLFPKGYLRRAVLLTDGVQTDGDLLAEVSRAKEHHVKIFAKVSTKPVPAEVALRDLKIPPKVRVGEPFDVRASIFSSRSTEVRAILKQGEAINGLDGVRTLSIKPGENEVVFKSVVRVAGEVTYAMDLVDVKDDRFLANNHYVVSASVPGRPTVLYVEGNVSRATYLSNALSAQEFDVDVRAPKDLPTSIRELERYDFVILSDAAADTVSLSQQDTIESYVRDLGGGFLFAGGENGYGLGGWYHTTIERILPVRMDAEKSREEAPVAMALVIDRSGSMSGLPLEMAKAAAKATADTLAGDDLLEVIAFDSAPSRVVKMTAAKQRARIQNDIARIQPGGGTEIFPALDAAYQSLSVTRARRKHALLLTDGQAPTAGIRDLVQSMVAENMTVSSVGLGAGVDEQLLRMVADIGGGRFYKVLDPQALPKVFTRETEMVSRSAAVEEYFQPKVSTPADFLRGVDIGAAPFLHGYVATKMKPPPAQQILVSEVGEPILARWHVGLGYTLAWTSDVKNLWAVEWLKWGGYGQFWGQLVREHMRQKKRQQFDMRAEMDIATGRVRASIDAVGGDDRFQNGLDAKLDLKGPEPGGTVQRVPMHQTAPGRYEADFPLDKYGSFLLHASLEKERPDDPKAKPVTVAESFGHISNPYPREYLAFAPDTALLSRATSLTGGRLGAEPREIFDPAGEKNLSLKDLWPKVILASLVVYLLDLLLRRVRIFDRKRTERRA